MYETKVIEKKMIALFVGLMNQTSVMSFGGYDKSYIKNGSEAEGFGVHWYPLIGKNWWQIDIQDVGFEGTSIFSGDASSCIVDSGTSMITVPVSDFNRFKAIIDAKWPDEEIYCQDGVMCFYYGKCAEFVPKLDHIKIQLGDNWIFSVAPEDYMIEEVDGNKTFCYFGIFGDEKIGDMIILGDAFLRAYYSIYDFENDRIGIAVHKYSASYLEKKFPKWIIIVIVAVSILFLIIIGVVIYKCI